MTNEVWGGKQEYLERKKRQCVVSCDVSFLLRFYMKPVFQPRAKVKAEVEGGQDGEVEGGQDGEVEGGQDGEVEGGQEWRRRMCVQLKRGLTSWSTKRRNSKKI